MSTRTKNGAGDDGSIVITILVMIVASALVLALVSLAENALRSSRRAGDSANALQVADAGISDAVAKASAFELANATPASWPAGYTCSVAAGVRQCSGFVDVADSRATVVATRDAVTTEATWHVVSTGVDFASKQKRRIRADAVSTVGPAIALFVSANMQLNAGTEVDSYRSTTATCTGNGYVGTNDAVTMELRNPQGASGNCRSSWPYYYDGCVSYADANPADFTSDSGCPPAPARKKVTPAFVTPTVYPPAGAAVPQGAPCNNGNPLVGGQSYFWTSVDLHDGCRITPTSGNYKVKIYTTGQVNLGQGGGGGVTINTPVGNAGCAAQGGDIQYCPRWPENLQIFVVSSDPGTQVVVQNNNVSFWGVITAPTAALSACSGCPQSDFWGAFVFASAVAPVQLKLHYDESLGGSTVGRFERRNWVQEAA